MRNGSKDLTWSWDGGVIGHTEARIGAGGPLGLLVIALVAGVVSGVAEALGALFNTAFGFLKLTMVFFRPRVDR